MTLRLPNAMDPRLRAPRIEAAPVDLAGALIEVANLLAAATPEELGAAIRTISETMAETIQPKDASHSQKTTARR